MGMLIVQKTATLTLTSHNYSCLLMHSVDCMHAYVWHYTCSNYLRMLIPTYYRRDAIPMLWVGLCQWCLPVTCYFY